MTTITSILVSCYEQTLEEKLIMHLNTPKGRKKLSAAMTAPLRQRVNYQALGQRMFLPKPLPKKDDE